MRTDSVQWWIEITERCNLKCKFCYNTWRDRPAVDLVDVPASRVIGWIESCRRIAPGSEIILAGGEALVHKDIHEITEAALKGGPVSIVTNGERLSALSDKTVSQLREVQVSLLSVDPALHRSLSGGGQLVSAVQELTRARELVATVSVVFVLCAENLQDLSKMAQLCAALGIDYMMVNPLIVTGRAAINTTACTEVGVDDGEQLQEQLARISRMNVEVLFGNPFSEPVLNDIAGVHASSRGRNRKFAVSINGAVAPCSSIAMSFGPLEDYDGKLDLLLRKHTEFWAAPETVEGCACAELVVAAANAVSA